MEPSGHRRLRWPNLLYIYIYIYIYITSISFWIKGVDLLHTHSHTHTNTHTVCLSLSLTHSLTVSLSLSLSLAICPYHPSILVGPSNYIQFLHRPNVFCGQPILARPCVIIHRKKSPKSSSLPLPSQHVWFIFLLVYVMSLVAVQLVFRGVLIPGFV